MFDDICILMVCNIGEGVLLFVFGIVYRGIFCGDKKVYLGLYV